jgi:prophage regulatory protein
MTSEYMDAAGLEDLTGTPKSTWRYWATVTGEGPPSFCIGRRRVWRRSTVLEWLAQQEQAAEETPAPRVPRQNPRRRKASR